MPSGLIDTTPAWETGASSRTLPEAVRTHRERPTNRAGQPVPQADRSGSSSVSSRVGDPLGKG